MNRYIFFIFLSLIFSLSYFFVKNRDQDYRSSHFLISMFILVGLTIELIGELTSRYGLNNSLYYNLLFVYGQTSLFIYFFYLISENLKVRHRIIVLSIIFGCFGLVYSLFFQSIHLAFHNYSYALGSLILIILAINFFLGIFNLNKYEDKNLLAIPYFWIVTVILFFYSTTFFYFTPLRLLYEIEVSLIEPVHLVIRFLAGLMYVVLGLAFFAPYVFKEKY
jgi:hypothetical protein